MRYCPILILIDYIISWFQDKQLGVVRDKDDTTARLLLLAADLPAGYREPKVGDEITYIAGMDDQKPSLRTFSRTGGDAGGRAVCRKRCDSERRRYRTHQSQCLGH